jgi:hypothetical protein
MPDFIANIRAQLDTTQIPADIKKIEGNQVTFSNFTINAASLRQSIQNALDGTQFSIKNISIPSISKQMQIQGTNAGKQFASSFNVGMADITTQANNANNTIRHMQQTLAGMKFDRSSINLVTQDLESMNIAVSKVRTQINGNALNVRINGIDELGRAVTIVKQFDYASGQIVNVGKTISQSFDTGAQAAKKFSATLENANKAMKTGGLSASISEVQAKYEQFANTGHVKLGEIATDINNLITLQNQMANSTSDEALVADYEKFNETLIRLQNNFKIVSNYSKQFVSTTEVAALQNKMQSWLNNNTKAAKVYGAQVQNYIASLNNMVATGKLSRSQFNSIVTGFNNIGLAAEAAGLKGKTFGDSFKGALSSITRYISASTLIYAAIRAIRSGINDVIDLNTSLIDLRKTTDATESQLKSFYYTANDTAKQLGATTKEVIQAAADWSRLGYSIKDAQTMAETSSIFSSISPGMDISFATDGLVSAMKAFDIEADDALDGIASKINAIGNTQAVENQDIVNILTRSSSAMAEANNTLEETIALGTAATEITRDAEAVGKVYADFKNNYIG